MKKPIHRDDEVSKRSRGANLFALLHVALELVKPVEHLRPLDGIGLLAVNDNEEQIGSRVLLVNGGNGPVVLGVGPEYGSPRMGVTNGQPSGEKGRDDHERCGSRKH